jgi:hypothetical protein
MKYFTTDSYRHLLIVLFFFFEVLLVASVVVLLCIGRRRSSGIDDAAAIAFWFSFAGQLVVCFFLRRMARPLAVIGWITLFVGFWGLTLLPVT